MTRVLAILACAAAGLVSSACGADSKPAAPGSAERPLAAATPTDASAASRSNEAAVEPAGASPAAAGSSGSAEPNYEDLLARQRRNPRSRFTPCNLVTRAQAAAIMGAPVRAPVEGSQGPTCIYRADGGNGFVTVAVQDQRFGQAVRRLQQRRPVTAAGAPAYCGYQGQSMLLARLSSARVLSVAGPCAIAGRFAATAVQRLRG